MTSAGCEFRESLAPNRLWSLWEMLDKHALLFSEAMLFMIEFKYYAAEAVKANRDVLPSQEMRIIGKGAMQKLKHACVLSDVDVLLGPIDRLISSLEGPFLKELQLLLSVKK